MRKQADEFRVLLKAVRSLIHDHKMLQAAFSHAGIDIAVRSVKKMLNPPPSAPSAKRMQSGGSQNSWSTPEQPPAPDVAFDNLDDALAHIAVWEAASAATVAKYRAARDCLKETKATADDRVQQAAIAARLDSIDEKRQQSRVSYAHINGMLGMGDALARLLEKQKRREQAALGQRKTAGRLEREAPLRDALNLGDTERLTTKIMAQYLKDNGVPTAVKSRAQLLRALANHLDVELAEDEDVDVGAAAEEADMDLEEDAMDRADEGDGTVNVQVRRGMLEALPYEYEFR